MILSAVILIAGGLALSRTVSWLLSKIGVPRVAGRTLAPKVAVFLVVAFFLPGAVLAQLADSPWPTYKGNNKHTGLSPYPTDIEEPILQWKFDAGDGIETSPIIGPDGTIYFGSFRNNFYAVNPDGSEKWRFTREGEEFRSSAAVASDGTIYFGAVYDLKPVLNQMHGQAMDAGVPKIYALNPDGSLKWEFVTGGIISGTYPAPTIGPDGTIYIGAGAAKMTDYAEGGDRLWALNPDGTPKWSFPTDEAIFTSVAVGLDGTLYLACANGIFWALNPDGTERWRFEKRDGYFDATPTIGPDGTIYLGSTNKNLYALTPEGKEKWHFTVQDILEATPSIGPDGTVYSGVIDTGSEDHNLYAINPATGEEKWRFETGDGVFATPAIDKNGILYFGSYDGNLYSLNPDGTERWRYKTEGGIELPPSIDKDGIVYFGSWDNHIYAIGGERSGEKTPAEQDDGWAGEGGTSKFMLWGILAAGGVAVLLIILLKNRKKL